MSLFSRATLRVPGQLYPADATVHATIPCKPCSVAVPPYVPQITPKSCWAAATTMIVSAHDSVTYTIDAVLQKAAAKAVGDLPPPAPTIQDLRYYLNHGMPNSGDQFPNFLGQLGISLLPASLTPAAICALLSNHGPIGANIDVGVDPDLDDEKPRPTISSFTGLITTNSQDAKLCTMTLAEAAAAQKAICHLRNSIHCMALKLQRRSISSIIRSCRER